MKEVIAIVPPERWEATRLAAEAAGARAHSRQRVLGRGRQGGLRYLARAGAAADAAVSFLPKVFAIWVVEDDRADVLVRAVLAAGRSDRIGAGAVFVLPVERVERVRTGERNEAAVRPSPVTGTLAGAEEG